MLTKSQILRKEQILSNLIETRQRILIAAARVSDAEQNQVFLGIWSIKDLLAHLIGWDKTNLNAIKSVMQNQLPSFYEHRDHDWQTYNAMLVRKNKKDSFQELFVTAKDSHERLIKFLRTIPPETFNKDFGVRFHGYKVTIQRLLEAETEDEQTHCEQIRSFFKSSK